MEVHSLAAAAAAGLASCAASVLVARLWFVTSKLPRPEGHLPWFLRIFWIPAALLVPVVRPLLGERQGRRIQRALAAVELEAALTPQSWIGMRVVHGACTALSGVAGGILAHLSVLPIGISGFLFGYSLGGLWMRSTRRELERRITRDLPSYLDLLTVCVEAGATLTAGINRIVEQAPESPLRRYFDHVLREVRGGRLRAQAFEHVAELYAVPSLSTLAATLAHSESSGMSLGGILRVQAQQLVAERFARAEKLAMQAPVKLLGPLILCIFPCTFIVLAVPIVVRLSQALAS